MHASHAIFLCKAAAIVERNSKMKSAYLVIVLAMSSIALWAQGTSQIQGVVQDATRAAIGGAEVKATQTDTGAIRTVASSEDGTYVLSNLPLGPYRLEVSRAGFTTYLQTGIVLRVATNPTINVALQVGAASEQIQVEANAGLVETQTTSVGNVIENQRILELPLNGRNAVELIQIEGGAGAAGMAGTAGFPGGLNLSGLGG